MRRRSLLARSCGLAALFAASSSSAQIFKCPVNGVQVFQQSPCPGLGAGGGRLLIQANGQRAPQSATEREAAAPPTPHVYGKTKLRTPTSADGRKSP
jgi:hypothetical protein